MIVSTIEGTSRTVSLGEETQWRCLARRGMLYSECEAFDYLRLRPGTEFALQGRAGTEGIWFILAGYGTLREPGRTRTDAALEVRDVVLLPDNEEILLFAGKDGIELLWLAVTPGAITRFLPHRRPAI